VYGKLEQEALKGKIRRLVKGEIQEEIKVVWFWNISCYVLVFDGSR
jgi:hypothetical protein